MDVDRIYALSASLDAPLERDSSAQTTINVCLERAKDLLAFVHKHPALPLALLQHEKSDISEFTRHLFTLTIFAKLNHFNDHFLQHLVAAHIAAYTMSESDRALPIDKRSFIRYLNDNKLTLWRETLSLQKVLFSAQSLRHVSHAKLNTLQRFSLLTAVFTYCRSSYDMPRLLGYLAPLIPTADRKLLYSPLKLIGAIMPSARVFYKAYPAVVIDVQQGHALIHVASMEDGDQALWVATTTLQQPRQLHVEFPRYLTLYNELKTERKVQGGAPFFSTTYAIQKPPSTLLRIIDSLQNPHIEINKLCEQIERSEAFSTFLKTTASRDNRLRLPVDNLKQAILTYGLGRVGDMLVQFALLERLTQHSYPLLSVCKQFTMLACAISSQLVTLTSSRFSPQSAALVTTFLCAPLFTLPGLKVATRLPVSHAHYFQVHRTFKIKGKTPWHTVAGELATQWHQGATWRALIHQAGKRHNEVAMSLKKEHAILQLSFGLARELLFPLTSLEGDDAETKRLLLQTLSLQPNDISQLTERLNEYLFCPFMLSELN